MSIKQYPCQDNNLWICSDGRFFTEVYYANRHEQNLSKKRNQKKQKNENE